MAPPTVRDKVQTTAAAFAARFARPARWGAAAPGRVNLIGEHTDYNDGFVLPMAIDRHTIVAAAPVARRDGARVRIHSEAVGGGCDIAIEPTARRAEPAWANHARGVIAGYSRLAQAGQFPELPGLDLLVTSDIPLGAGLASSASFEVALATAIEAAAGQALPPMTKARLCQEAEQELAGVPCGIMDHASAALARPGMALLIDCGDESVRAVPVPADLAVLIVDSGKRHDLADGSYQRRRSECAAAAHALGVASLRATSPAAVEAAAGRLDPVSFRRAFHVVNENVRTLAAAAALLKGDLATAGGFLYESHRSLRELYEVSCAELDQIVAIAHGIGEPGGIFGARLTGGGFGGSAVVLARANAAEAIGARIAQEVGARHGWTPTVFLATSVGGAATFELEARR